MGNHGGESRYPPSCSNGRSGGHTTKSGYFIFFIFFIEKNIFFQRAPGSLLNNLSKKEKKGGRKGDDHIPRPRLATESLSLLGYSHRPTVMWGKRLHALDSYLSHSSETESSRLMFPSGGSTALLSISPPSGGAGSRVMTPASTAMASDRGAEV